MKEYSWWVGKEAATKLTKHHLAEAVYVRLLHSISEMWLYCME